MSEKPTVGSFEWIASHIKEHPFTVICQKWEESERGWGTRPDGYSLHLTIADCGAFIEEYWDKMPDRVPDEYSRPDGDPYECPVTEEVYLKVKASKNGLTYYGTPPWPYGKTGWVPASGGMGYLGPGG